MALPYLLVPGLLLLLYHSHIISGGVVFPLRSVNVTLVRHEKDVPIVELQLIRDVADYLEPLPPDARPQFFLQSVLPPHNAFFIHDHLLILRGASQNTSAFESNYQITIGGRQGSEGPAYMTVNATFTNAVSFCETHTRDACFWPASLYQMPENLEPPEATLAALSSPLLATVCPLLLVAYTLPCHSSAKCTDAVIERKDNGHGSWQLSLQTALDREAAATEEVLVQCEVTGPSNSSHTYLETITVDVVDVDDERPQVNIHSLNITTSMLREGEEVAKGNVSDKDLPGTNHLEFSVDVEWLRILCTPVPYATSSVFHCSVISSEDTSVTDDVPFTITVKDKSLLTGFGSRIIRKTFMVHAPKPQSLAVVQRSVIKYPEVVSVAEGAVSWTRVAAPENSHGYHGTFNTVSPHFAVTPEQGILYVTNSRGLISGRIIKLTIKWDGGEEIVSVQITKPVAGVCGSSREKNYKAYCAKTDNEIVCNSLCGVGLIPDPGSGGGCHWVETKSLAPMGSWWSCSPSPATCPDTVCDELELLQPALCPQDCAKQSLGTGAKKIGSLGIAGATGKCHCVVETQRCMCSDNHAQETHVVINNYNTTHLSVEPSESDGILCGWACQLSAAGSFLGLSVGAVIVLLYIQRLRTRSKRSSCTEPEVGKADVVGYDESVRPLRTSVRDEPTTSTPSVPSRPQYYDEKWEFPRNRLTIYETVGEGEFGKVVKATADGIRGHKGLLTVAVKTVRGGCAEEDLVSELELLKEVDHPNVIKLLGACTTLEGPLYLIIEFAHLGSLRNYLRMQRETVQAGDFQPEGLVSYPQLLTFAWHIAKGMEYLSDMKLVHRDLAARNVLLTEELVCKISDFGLTRDIYEDDTYLKRSKGKVPIKWMAVECLSDDLYTIKSDVWSYGVLLWEIVTFGSTPYPGISARNLFSLLQGGYRMEQPSGCSPKLYSIMRACWAAAPPDRPSFSAIVLQLDALLTDTSPHPYLQLAVNAIDNPHYIHPWGPVAGNPAAGYDQPREPACCCEPSKCSHPRYLNELHALLPNDNTQPDSSKASAHDTSHL